MSMALGHFALGATLTALAVTYLLPSVAYPRSLVVLGGVWAMVPDARWVVPAASTRLRPLHDSAWADLFFFHRTLDLADPGDSAGVTAALAAAFVVATVLAERRSYRSLAAIRSGDEKRG